MPSSDYTNAVGGGLKLKGAKDSGVKKSKKKKSKPTTTTATTDAQTATPQGASSIPTSKEVALHKVLADEEKNVLDSKARDQEITEFGKTEAQRRHEERRRKRLDDRLKREGFKTHKERVEELNKYLSGLSEHHDMPRIGPG
ncbi:Eukaryotic family of unknown function (DUF1754) [Acrodontium crateriforme]|uniref:DUF1754-domain-containing protein n=1 Tax=Acrodontium crateriforme TaxID=150365 RepID=A0AAQ3RD47_9PEZI|nr:Eukaryotic family of unknown function (DUF1754) [Acrodontium crateriforme]